MWTDDHISKKLLELHLNPEIDSASRMPDSINKTIEFIKTICEKSSMSILDLGCGPGIYMEKLAELGHKCTGIDFSKNSISYAKNRAKERGLEISYLNQDYLELDFENQFDLIILIYTDLGVLLPDERVGLLDKIYRALKPNGVFIFDLINDKNAEQKFQEQLTWTLEYSGFWKPTPYMELANGFHYPDDKVFLKQHTIIDESDRVNNYRFWTHYFSCEDVITLLSARRFLLTECFENILPATDVWNGENITFYKTRK
jgi:2-polyprenyl-3-methyl-5-hydroxy-6-metoxy-1,4-benzoquinol methylase